MPITFKVADKKPEAIEIKTPSKRWRRDGQKSVIAENHYLNRCAEYEQKKCKKILQESDWDVNNSIESGNGFVYAATAAYNNHHNLVLSPDDVWISITTQFSLYVNGNAEELRSKFVAHEEKKELVVKQVASLETADYGELAEQMVLALKENIKIPEMADWILPKFTTTSHTDIIVGSVVFMATMKKYFDYKFCLCCGIPEVTLLGTPEDWKSICDRVAYLQTFGGVCDKWSNMLGPVVEQFYNSSLGKPDVDFWQRICHYDGGGSGPTYLSGWITAFCVFDEKGKWCGENFTAESWGKTIRVKDFPILDSSDIPPGYATVPVTIDDNGTLYKSLMFAGHMTKKRVDETTIAPQLSWAIVLKLF